MKTARLLPAALAATMALSASAVTIDQIDSTNAGAGTYFVPTDGQKYDWPYYRWAADDWSWTQNPVVGAFASVELSVSAFDVDAAYGEVDNIYGYDTDTTSWILLGSLAGGNDIWAFTTLTIVADLYNEVAMGLSVRIDIDTTNAGWAVTLAKSTLTTDGADPGNPDPGTPPPSGVPESGTTLALLGLGLAALAMMRRKAA